MFIQFLKKSFKITWPYALVIYIFWQAFLTFFDISTRHINENDNPDFKATVYFSRNPVYLLSYASGDEVFYQNQNALVQSALGKGIDFFLSYRPSLIDEKFYEAHKTILSEKAGAGYWLWKPYIILKTLETTPENTVVVYADSGMIFTDSLMPLIKYTKNNDAIFFISDEKTYANLDGSTDKQVSLETKAFDHPNFKKFPQIWAAFMIFKNTQNTRNFVKKWLDMCLNHNWLRGYGVSSHRHDQSLMGISLLLNPDGMKIMHEKDYWPMVKWQHRHKNEENFSLMPYQKNGMHYYMHKIWRYPPLRWLRYTLFKGS